MIIYFDIETVSDTENLWNFNMEKLEKKYGEKIKFAPEVSKIFTITVWTNTKDGRIIKNLEGSEEEQIKAFFKAIEGNIICWFNIKAFDLPFIIKRALKHQIDIPDCIKFFWKKPWEMENIIDLFEVYRNGVFWAIGSLDLVCNFLGITSPKDDNIDGGQVQRYFLSDRKFGFSL